MVTPGRSFSARSQYKYGFNGKENDRDISEGAQDYGMRVNDVRLGKFLSVDPLAESYPWYTPYQFAGNTPIQAIDLDGGEPYAAAYKFANNTNPIQNLFHADNIINMSNSINPTSFNSLGWQRDASFFWNKYINTPLGKQALSKANLEAISNGRSPVVDEQWNDVMKIFKNDGKLEEIIDHHHHNKGGNAIPIPKSKHTGQGYGEVNHGMNERVGPVSQKFGRIAKMSKGVGSALSTINVFTEVIGIYRGNPDVMWSAFVQQNKVGIIYKNLESGLYFSYTKLDRTATDVTGVFNIYGSYEWDSKQKKYIGIDLLGHGEHSDKSDGSSRTITYGLDNKVQTYEEKRPESSNIISNTQL